MLRCPFHLYIHTQSEIGYNSLFISFFFVSDGRQSPGSPRSTGLRIEAFHELFWGLYCVERKVSLDSTLWFITIFCSYKISLLSFGLTSSKIFNYFNSFIELLDFPEMKRRNNKLWMNVAHLWFCHKYKSNNFLIDQTKWSIVTWAPPTRIDFFVYQDQQPVG